MLLPGIRAGARKYSCINPTGFKPLPDHRGQCSGWRIVHDFNRGKLYLRTDGRRRRRFMSVMERRELGRRSDCRVTMIWEKSCQNHGESVGSARVAGLFWLAYEI